MKTNDSLSRPLQMPRFKHLRPEPLDSPLYRRGYLVGAVVLGKREPPGKKATKSPVKGGVP